MSITKSAAGTPISILRASNKLREAIEAAGGEATIAIMAPEPVGTAFREYVEAVRKHSIDLESLQSHMDDEIRKLDEDAKP